jgi:DNA-cytosine methyltransferase
MKGITVLSLFDGMSCGRIALETLGIKVQQYYAAEIDKHAIQVTQHNFPNTIQLGDVTKVKIKLLCLSEVYSYLCAHDNDLQSKISEQEVLHWLNEEYTISKDFGTQKQNEGQAIRQPSALQCFEKIRIAKCGMGSFVKAQNISRGGTDGDKTHIGNPFKLQCGEWWYGDDIQRGDKEKNITGAIRQAENGNLQTENIGNLKGKISRRKRKETDFKENEKSDVDKGGEKELFGRSKENKLNGKVGEEKGNGGIEANGVIENLISKLQSWDETNGTSETYRDFLRLHSQEQVTVVEYAGGLKIFKGRIDLLCGGSPCQGFSFAGKQLAFDDPRSKLFFEFVRLKNECNPTYFMLENVKMKKEFEIIISKYMGVAPIEINSALLSAQNRVRLYWTNIANEPYGLFGDMQCMIPQPKDKGILLRDILEIDVPEKYFVKSKTMFDFVTDGWRQNKKYTQINGDKAITQQARQYASWRGDYITVGSKKNSPSQKDNLVMQLNQSTESNGCQPYQQNRVYDIDGICPALMSQMNCGTHAILIPEATKKGFIEVKPGDCFDFENSKSETRRGRKMEDKSNCLMAKETDFMHYTTDFRIRRLTPNECKKLQTIPDWYDMSVVSDTQQYKMLGNGWTVSVIAHIFSFMNFTK